MGVAWEFENASEMYSLLVGKYYGQNPESIGAKIHEDRMKIGRIIYGYLGLKPTDHVLEVGSGDMAAFGRSYFKKSL